jgi:hypothetical protein
MPLTVAYVGNFGPPNSTENDLLKALGNLGHSVIPLQEEQRASWQALRQGITDVAYDLILWTRTASLAAEIPHDVQRLMQYQARRAGIPTVGYHLDRWWGLARETDIFTEPWFQCDHVFTADGAHAANWLIAGVNHHWLPPAIAADKCYRGSIRDDFNWQAAFVGSWQGGYHEEWPHRQQLVDKLRNALGRKVAFFPQRQGDQRIDREDRADLFATVKVVIGDSALVPAYEGVPMHHYCSDRVFETIGQGGLLLHPYVEGIIGNNPADIFQAGTHCLAWTLYDWADLAAKIQWAATHPAAAETIKQTGFDLVRTSHTYNQRMQAMLDIVLPAAS